LPADARSGALLPNGQTLGHHPEYSFVAAYNRCILGDPSHDPDAIVDDCNLPQATCTGLLAPQPAGSNIGIIRDGQLVAATFPIPIGVIDNLAFASGFNYLFAAFRGAEVSNAGDGAVFVYNLVNLVREVEQDYASDTGRLR